MVIWYIFPVLVFCTQENLATLELQAKTDDAPVETKKRIFFHLAVLPNPF
jgi:hypothetical protein